MQKMICSESGAGNVKVEICFKMGRPTQHQFLKYQWFLWSLSTSCASVTLSKVQKKNLFSLIV